MIVAGSLGDLRYPLYSMLHSTNSYTLSMVSNFHYCNDSYINGYTILIICMYIYIATHILCS